MNLEDLKTAMYELQLDEISPQKMVDVTNDDLINALDYKFGNNTLNQRKNETTRNKCAIVPMKKH